MTSDGPTPELMCAVRVATANDTEVVLLADQLDPAKQRLTKSKKRKVPGEGEGMRQLTRAVSEESEARALAALHETVAAILVWRCRWTLDPGLTALVFCFPRFKQKYDEPPSKFAFNFNLRRCILDQYPTSDAEDEAALLGAGRGAEAEGVAGKGADAKEEEDAANDAVEEEAANDAAPAALEGDVREAVRCRLREKLLLVNAMGGLQRRLPGRPFDLSTAAGGWAGGGAGGAGGAPPEDGGTMSPPEGFQAAKSHYRGKDKDGEL